MDVDWTSIIVALLAAIPGGVALYSQVKKIKTDELSTDAEAAAVYERLARESGQSIIDLKAQVKALENNMHNLQSEIRVLQGEKSKLEHENQLLEKRVKKLESILSAHDIPLPNGS